MKNKEKQEKAKNGKISHINFHHNFYQWKSITRI